MSSFLDSMAYSFCATKDQRKAIRANDKKKAEKDDKPKGKSDKKDSKASSSKSSSMAYPQSGSILTNVDEQKRSETNSIADLYRNSEDGVYHDDRSALPLLHEPRRPSTVPTTPVRSHASKPQKQKKETKPPTRSALEEFGRRLFDPARKSSKRSSSHKIPGKWVDSSPEASRSLRPRSSQPRGRSSRPRTPEPTIAEEREREEEEEAIRVYLDANFDPSRINNWLDDVDEGSLATSGVVLSDESGCSRKDDGGYHMDSYPMRSDYGTDVGSNVSTVMPGDSVTVVGRPRRHPRERKH